MSQVRGERMPVFTADYLKKIGADIFERIGASRIMAEHVADSLVKSNLFGHDSHGVIRIPQYMNLIRAGCLNPSAKIEVEKETLTTATLNGNWGFGQIIAQKKEGLFIEDETWNQIVKCANQLGVTI